MIPFVPYLIYSRDDTISTAFSAKNVTDYRLIKFCGYTSAYVYNTVQL